VVLEGPPGLFAVGGELEDQRQDGVADDAGGGALGLAAVSDYTRRYDVRPEKRRIPGEAGPAD
jgi:hypothetical protein